MNLSAFPPKNYYFNSGLEALQGLTKTCTIGLHAVIVVNLTQWSLKEVVSSPWMENSASEKVLIVSNIRFFPLAKYYQFKNSNIVAICTESESLKVLGDFICGRLVEQGSNDYQKPHLTEKEFISLRYALDGVSAKEQAQEMGVCTKTVFAFRYNLAKKLQVKKLSHLLSSFSRSFRSYGLSISALKNVNG